MLDGLYGFVRARVAEGRQAYFVCPLVEDSETDATSAEQLYEELNTRRLRVTEDRTGAWPYAPRRKRTRCWSALEAAKRRCSSPRP